jgi:dihydroorotase
MLRYLLVVVAALGVQAQDFDLVLRGGLVIDPKNGLNSVRRDIAIKDGRIAAVEASIDAARGRRSVDVSSLTVTPGLIDLHVHTFYTINNPGAWAGDLSIQPDAFSFRTGVTTMVDAGSSGWRNFEQFRQTVIDRAKTRVLAMINIAGHGMISDLVEQGDFDPKKLAALAVKHKDVVVGVKSAHYQKADWMSVDEAVAAGKLAGIPVMVDFGYFLPERPYWKLVTEHLRPGDISTHMFRAPVPWVDESGKLYEYLKKARERGVIFDLGHGGGSFAFRNGVGAIGQGFYPDTISTDLHDGSMNAPMQDMPNCMAKCLAMGMPLEAVIRASTWKPAQVIHREAEIGHLSVGAVADIAAWALETGDHRFADSHGASISGKTRLRAELTVRAGAVVWDRNARSGTDLKKMPARYGVRRGMDAVVVPPKQ